MDKTGLRTRLATAELPGSFYYGVCLSLRLECPSYEALTQGKKGRKTRRRDESEERVPRLPAEGSGACWLWPVPPTWARPHRHTDTPGEGRGPAAPLCPPPNMETCPTQACPPGCAAARCSMHTAGRDLGPARDPALQTALKKAQLMAVQRNPILRVGRNLHTTGNR